MNELVVSHNQSGLPAEITDVIGSGTLRIGDRFFVDSQDAWTRILAGLQAVGFDLKPTDAPNAAGTLYVCENSERMSRVRCDGCAALMSTLGCKAASGHWCSECGRLLHLDITAEPGRESVFLVAFSDPALRGGAPEVRLRLIDFDPAAQRVTLAAEPLGSKWRRDDPEPEREEQRAVLRRFAHLLRPVQATRRMTVDDDIGHTELEHPLDAFEFGWPYGWQKTGSGENPNAGGLVELCPESVFGALHRSTEVTLLGERVIEHDRNPFGKHLSSIYLVPAFSNYPLPRSAGLLNQAMDHLGMQAHSLLPDYVERSGGWKPTRLGDEQLDCLRTFMDSYTSVDMDAWDAAVNKKRHGHHSHLLLALARVCSPLSASSDDACVRMSWNEVSRGYYKVTFDQADAWMARKLSEEIVDEAVDSVLGSLWELMRAERR